jgi:hypothetical protein
VKQIILFFSDNMNSFSELPGALFEKVAEYSRVVDSVSLAHTSNEMHLSVRDLSGSAPTKIAQVRSLVDKECRAAIAMIASLEFVPNALALAKASPCVLCVLTSATIARRPMSRLYGAADLPRVRRNNLLQMQ